MYPQGELLGPVFLLYFGATLTLWFWYLRLLKMGAGSALLAAAIGVAIAPIGFFATDGRVVSDSPLIAGVTRPDDSSRMLALAALIFAVGFAFGLLIKVYRAWVLDAATAAERGPNSAGFRAWLSPMNCLTVIFLAIAAAVATGSAWGLFFGALGLLLAYPILNTAMKSEPVLPAQEPEDLASERQRVLALVEAGKVSAEDGAELITALGQSRVVQAEQSNPLSGGRRVILLGAMLVLLGFCLPWFEIRMDEVMKEAMQGMQQVVGQAMPAFAQENPANPNVQFGLLPGAQSAPVQNVSLLMLRGGDLAYGLGWFIMIAAVGTAVLPFVWQTRPGNRQQHRGVSLVAVGAGSIALLYLIFGLAMGPSRVQIGFVLVCVGYVVAWVGLVREYVRVPAVGRPALSMG
jgi:hypothetical protein